MTIDKPEAMNIGGRFSFHSLTAQAAYDSAHRADSKLLPTQRPDTVNDAQANFTILLNETGLEVVKEYILDKVLPWFEQELKAGNPKMTIDQDGIDLLRTNIKDNNFGKKMGSTPFRDPSEKTLELAPNTAASIQMKAYKRGTDIKQEAFVSEEEHLISLPFSTKRIYPIEDTVFELYAGCYVKATVTFWAGAVNGNPYLSCSANSVVFWKDGASFAGGGTDEEGMLADDDLFLED